MLMVFPYLIKNKGTIKAVKEAVNAFIDIKQIKKVPFINIEQKECNITIGIEVDYVNTLLLESVLKYILPTGWSYNIIFTKVFNYEDAIGEIGRSKNIVNSIIETTNSSHGSSYGYVPTSSLRGMDDNYNVQVEKDLIGAIDMGYVQGSDCPTTVYLFSRQSRDDGVIPIPSVAVNGNFITIDDPSDIAQNFVVNIDNGQQEITIPTT